MEESTTRRLLRTRDAMDRDYAQPLDVAALARIALLSPSHFTRRFKATFGETPHQYLYRRRIERAKWLLRDSDLTVTDICFEVGYTSIGTFTRTFVRLVGETPGRHRARGPLPPAPGCIVRAWARDSRFGEARSEPDP
jgi:AraC-like DNA-binding protein